MKQSDLIVLGLAGVAVWLIWQSTKSGGTKAATAPAAGRGTLGGWVDEIFDAAGQPFANGWRYYENGVAIDPAGNYYYGGQMVWRAPLTV